MMDKCIVFINKYNLKNIIQKILPFNVFIRILKWKRGFSEAELRLIPLLCDKSKISLDIGASDGIYTIHMLKYSKKIYAFEPRTEAASYLEKLLKTSFPVVQVECVALSDRTGHATLRIIPHKLGSSTIEEENPLETFGVVQSISTPVKRLDDYEFGEGVGFIKIDVEGHEEAVLRGAKRTLARDHPSLIVEIEDRHKPGAFKAVNSFLEELDYLGFFYQDRQLRPIKLFNKVEHQNVDFASHRGNVYINNFVFLSRSVISGLKGNHFRR